MRCRNGASSTRFSAAVRRWALREPRGLAAIGARRLAAVGVAAPFGDDAPPVVVEIAVERSYGPVGHDPQAIRAGVDQVAVVRDQDHGARIIVDRLDQRGAAVDVEMVGRLVEDDEVGPGEGREPEQQPRLLAARERRDLGVAVLAGKPDRADAGAHLRFGASGIRART